MIPLLFVLILAPTAGGPEPSIVFDNRPPAGLPLGARTQKPFGRLDMRGKPFRALAGGTVKTVRVRYFNKETWATEEQARAYVAGFFAHPSLEVYDFQVWSQGVGVPEVECVVEFTDAHLRELRDAGEVRGPLLREGRLLLWNTEACFRDATGRWWFVTAFDHYHAAHPKGQRDKAKGATGK